MCGRPITAEEFERMLEATVKVRPPIHRFGRTTFRGSGYPGSGWKSRWSYPGTMTHRLLLICPVDILGSASMRRPKKAIRTDSCPWRRTLPISLLKTPDQQRLGLVFTLEGLQTHRPMTPKRIGRVVSAIGKKAGVVVNKAEGKYGSAHDLPPFFRYPLVEQGQTGHAAAHDAA